MNDSLNEMTRMDFLKLDQVVKTYGQTKIISDINLAATEGEFVVFVGPSGCGKSTLMRLIAGLDEVTEGGIYLDGVDVTQVPPADRRVSMVFQSYALYPHMNVRENMSFGLKMIKTPAAEIRQRVDEAAAILKLDHLMNRRPRELSGGQRQRVAIGRAIVRKPKLFLFDEPLSNLDAELRGEMRVEIARLHRELGVTMIYVTHDQVEAMTLADRIVVLRAGKVEQIGTPAELYDHPINTFVAGFIGSPKMNFIPMSVLAIAGKQLKLGSPALCSGEVMLPISDASAVCIGDEVSLGLRPEHLRPDDSLPLALKVQADYVENLGGTSQFYAKTVTGVALIAQASGRHSVVQGSSLTMSALLQHAYLFDAAGHAL